MLESKLNSNIWMVEPTWFQNRISEMRSEVKAVERKAASQESTGPLKISNSVGVVQISGPMQKQQDFMTEFLGFSSTNQARTQIRELLADKEVETIVLHIESPGGNVSGTFELAEEVRLAAQQKPVVAFIQDLGASAAYWVASQATQIISNEMAEVGSIGTVIVIPDFSKAMEDDGVKIHVVSTGDMKGAFSFGSEVTEAQLKMLQTRINDINQKFLNAVMSGRDMSETQISKVNDGRVFIASKAKSLGLIDGVSSFDTLVQKIQSNFDQKGVNRRKRAEMRLRILES